MHRRIRDSSRLLMVAPMRGSTARVERGFTLVEMLVTVAIVITLLALLVPALSRGLARARAFRCQASLRSVAFDFQVFADPYSARAHGDDEARFGPGKFSLETFIESEYGVDEFWDTSDSRNLIRRTSDDRADTTRCADVAGPIELRRNVPCRAGAVGPAENVSYTFNARLYQAEVLDSRGRPRARDVVLREGILASGAVPLVWDVDGQEAARRRVSPHWTAPAADSKALYVRDRLWFPSSRHSGQTNVALIDGSVHGEADPVGQSSWRWDYQPRP